MNHLNSWLSPAHGEYYHANGCLQRTFFKKCHAYERGKNTLPCLTFAFIPIAEAWGFPAHKDIRKPKSSVKKTNITHYNKTQN
jgi:hypothetical protein